jgi:hypothetical protein
MTPVFDSHLFVCFSLFICKCVLLPPNQRVFNQLISSLHPFLFSFHILYLPLVNGSSYSRICLSITIVISPSLTVKSNESLYHQNAQYRYRLGYMPQKHCKVISLRGCNSIPENIVRLYS